MSEFVASNGIHVDLTDGKCLNVAGPARTFPATVACDDFVDALREFFRHEEDERLGRWRWPENPDYVAYPRSGGDRVVVLSDSTGVTLSAERGQYEPEAGEPTVYGAARAFFDAHPEPKPWDGAEPGEYWTLTTGDGETRLYKMTDAGWRHEGKKHTPLDRRNRGGITAARRIWPTEDAS